MPARAADLVPTHFVGHIGIANESPVGEPVMGKTSLTHNEAEPSLAVRTVAYVENCAPTAIGATRIFMRLRWRL